MYITDGNYYNYIRVSTTLITLFNVHKCKTSDIIDFFEKGTRGHGGGMVTHSSLISEVGGSNP